MKKNILHISLIILLAFATNTLFAQSTNFSGKWQINKTKTDFGQAPEWVLPKIYAVSNGKSAFIISRVTLDAQLNEHPSTETLTFDGKEALSTLYNGSKRTSSLKWSADQQSFTITASSVMNTNPGPKISDTWSLSDNGKTLVIDRTVVNPDGGTYSLKAYYDKQ